MEVAKILLVEDNLGDIGLIRKAFERARIINDLHVVRNGDDAMEFLRKQGDFASVPTPDLVLLDLNLPGMDGREVLAAMKNDPALSRIPVVVLTTSRAHEDVIRSYELHANSFITKPPSLEELQRALTTLHSYWFAIVRLPDE